MDTDDSKAYVWDGSQWVSFKAAGSINTVVGSTSGIVNVSIATSGDQVTITTSLDNTADAAQFLAGPSGAAGAVSYRTITGDDLPDPTTTTKGGVSINGEGLRINAGQIEIDNDLASSGGTFSIVEYSDKGLVTDGRALIASDLPIATSSAVGAVTPGSGLDVDGNGALNHINAATPGTFTKVTIDSEGHVTTGDVIAAADLPNHSAALLTSGTIDPARIATNSILGTQIANYAVSKFGETQPTADHIGQFFFNPLSRDLFLWDGNVFQPIGISVGEIVFAGTFDASVGGGTGLVASVTADGTAVGLVAGQALPAAAAANSRYYLVVSEPGTITSGNAPNVALSPPDIILSNGNEWTEIDVSQTITAQVASNVSFTPAGDISSTNVQAALQELDTEKLAVAGGTMTGELLIGTAGSFGFEGSSANDYETYLTVVDPTADRTITFPDATGTVVLSGSIVNADINASAAIAFSKLATLTSANILVGSSGNVATSVAVTGDVTINNTGVTAIAAGVIVDGDVNASAAITGTKIQQGSTSVRGTVQLTDSTSSTSTTTAATPAAVKSAFDLANAALPRTGGTMTGAITFAAGQTISGYLATGDIGVTVQGYDADTAKTDVAQSFTAAQRGTVVVLTPGATVTPDFATGNNFSLALGENTTLANPTNLVAGQSGSITITQDSTARTLAYGNYFYFEGGIPTLGTTTGAVSTLAYYVNSTTRITAVLINEPVNA